MHISQTFALIWITLFFIIPYILWWICSFLDIFKIKKDWERYNKDPYTHEKMTFADYFSDNMTGKQLLLIWTHIGVIVLLFLVITVECIKAFK